MIEKIGDSQLIELGVAALNKLWIFLSMYIFFILNKREKENDKKDAKMQKRIGSLEQKVTDNTVDTATLSAKMDGMQDLFDIKIQHSHKQADDLKGMIRDLQMGRISEQ